MLKMGILAFFQTYTLEMGHVFWIVCYERNTKSVSQIEHFHLMSRLRDFVLFCFQDIRLMRLVMQIFSLALIYHKEKSF